MQIRAKVGSNLYSVIIPKIILVESDKNEGSMSVIESAIIFISLVSRVESSPVWYSLRHCRILLIHLLVRF